MDWAHIAKISFCAQRLSEGVGGEMKKDFIRPALGQEEEKHLSTPRCNGKAYINFRTSVQVRTSAQGMRNEKWTESGVEKRSYPLTIRHILG